MNEQTNLKLTLLKKLVKESNGTITADIIRLVEEITLSKNRSSIADLQKALNSLNEGIDEQTVIDVLSKAPQPPIVQSLIRNTFSFILQNVKLNFGREMPRFIDSISYDRQINRTVPRMIGTKTVKKLAEVNGINQWVQAIENSEDVEDWSINPEFKQLLLNGYKPAENKIYYDTLREDENLDNFSEQYGTPETDFIKNKNGDFLAPPSFIMPKEKVQVVITEQAGILKRALENVTASLVEDSFGLFMTLKGQSELNPAVSKNIKNKKPNWSIKYSENKTNNTYTILIDNFSPSISNTSSSIRFSGELDVGTVPTATILGSPESNNQSNGGSGLTPEALNRIAELASSQESCNPDIGSELGAAILMNRIGNIYEPSVDSPIDENGRSLSSAQKRRLNNYLKSNFDNIFSSFIKNSFSNIKNNRLLKRFDPTAGLNLNSLDEDPESRNTLIALSLIKFIPDITEELKQCGKSPHPLNFDQVIDLMEKKFNKIGINPQTDESTEETPPDPIVETISMAGMLLLVRTMVFKYLLKNLVVFDQFKYDSSLIESAITKEYLSIQLKKELQELGIYFRVERAVENNYDFLKENNIIINSDETIENISVSSIINGNIADLPSIKFKNIVSATLRKTVGYVKNLIGFTKPSNNESVNSESGQSSFRDARLLQPTKIYDIFSNNNSNRDIKIKFKNCDIERFIDKYKEPEQEDSQFFIHERFIKFQGFRPNIFKNLELYELFNNRLKIMGLIGIINFQEFSSFINDYLFKPNILDDNTAKLKDSITVPVELLKSLDNIFIAPKIGLRMSLIKREKIIKIENYFSSFNGANTEESQPLFFRISQEDTEQQSPKVLKNRVKLDRNHCFFDDSFDRSNNTTLIRRYYNSMTVDETYYDLNGIAELTLFKDVNSLQESVLITSNPLPIVNYTNWRQQIKYLDPKDVLNSDKSYNKIFKNLENYFNKNKNSLISKLNLSPDFQLMTKKAMSINKVINLISFYIDNALSHREINSLFNSCKQTLKSMMISAETLDDYEKPIQNIADRYSRDMNDVGNPSPQLNLDLLWFIITTPILIFKGITQIMDPNIAIASQIVNAASAGLLFPKIDPKTLKPVEPLEYPGDPVLLPTVIVSLLLLPVNIWFPAIGPLAIGPPVTPLGMIFWALEPLLWKFPWFLEKASESPAAMALSSNPEFENLSVGKSASSNFTCDKDQDEN